MIISHASLPLSRNSSIERAEMVRANLSMSHNCIGLYTKVPYVRFHDIVILYKCLRKHGIEQVRATCKNSRDRGLQVCIYKNGRFTL